MPVPTTEPRGTLVRHRAGDPGDIYVITGPHEVARAIMTIRFSHSSNGWTPTRMRDYGAYARSLDRIEDDDAQTQ